MVELNFQKVITLKERKRLKKFLPLLAKEEGFEIYNLSIVFCSDAYLLNINRTHLNHDYFTDIITFDYSNGNGINGELYISSERVRENARIHKIAFQDELLRVIFHGLLHLCGYNDKKKDETGIMRSKEDYYLSKFDSFHVKPN